MPNFRTKYLKSLTLPFEKKGISFLFSAKNSSVTLILTKFNDEKFFLQIKKEKDYFIIKADKHSKPSKIGLLQEALVLFRDEFCDNIIDSAICVKNNNLTSKTPLIASDFNELLQRIKDKKIYVEIGFGSGRHLLFLAKKNPEILILGVEIYNPSLNQVAKLAKFQNLNNILLIQSDARLLLNVLTSNSVEKIFLHFPVPWDKKPHRRVVSKEFCKEVARVLIDNGKFELRTDSFEYLDFTLKQFLSFKKHEILINKNVDLEISSKYEDRWKKQEKDIYDLIVSKISSDEKKVELEKFNIEEIKLNKEKLANFAKNFSKQKFKEDDFFLNLESIYETKENFVLKIAFGDFNKPEHSYLLLSDKIEFILNEPFKTHANLKALHFLRKILEF
ncbi:MULTISPECIES: tRNA (guanosine(46)-N7)-methyltransferase TrmB [unclassified Campylobacter]|uniref:tRNA (guanosine(46)-N7)-methyltransferase TrmB n=1 Tax=unclassified Campylobacter TaxID=2593542 RepID=UPI001237AF69|nr:MULTISPECIES: tRNA (guanosine(46)-N7)-methyltransferase TrmB [unclassified Campylobacter]KAA6224709.1 tRNA (guanosine(46)-N7)-methyltransferase TrmB [Campylobacter sp. LR185c]KAA6225707.1 tRNA (guanosine(46)-N7)-methyltransferase TrmB [Campylobacter sp. LR286c]KAA6225827.1 tRNA (guanosine(46)-N7)-methyltransferase TrmB [Campylobacter sp. LR196d]KAA6229680.1 tRNA (guanosine(46)-N7)-methyltransferase TrmB [Campylobacter sp. LR291e]KAA6230074.1 tRNA (guanosine(46)-N7)-methyltransferase TrmB [C